MHSHTVHKLISCEAAFSGITYKGHNELALLAETQQCIRGVKVCVLYVQ